MNIVTKELSPELWNDFEAYFNYQGKCSGCWCMNHRYPMGLDVEGEAARLSMKQLVETGRVFGVLAYVEGDLVPVGWASLDQKRTLPGHDCIGEQIDCSPHHWSLHCVTSREDYKNQGVEKALMEAGIKLAKAKEGTLIESYPEPESLEGEPFKTWNTFNGHESSFRSLGFKASSREQGEEKEFYHVLELDLKESP